MIAILPGLLLRYVLTLIGLQILIVILALVAEAYGWSEDLFRAANIGVLIGSASSAGNFLGQTLKAKPSWGMSLGLAFILSLVNLVFGALFVSLVVALGGVGVAELQAISNEIGFGHAGAILVFSGLAILLSYPVTLVGLRIGASAIVKHIEKQAEKEAANQPA